MKRYKKYRKTNGQLDAKTDRQTERQTDKQTGTQTVKDRKTQSRHKDTSENSWIKTQTHKIDACIYKEYRQTDICQNILTNKNRQRDKNTFRWKDQQHPFISNKQRKTDRQTDRHTQRQINRHKQRISGKNKA